MNGETVVLFGRGRVRDGRGGSVVMRGRCVMVSRGGGRRMMATVVASVVAMFGRLARYRLVMGIAANQQVVATLDDRCHRRVGVDDCWSRMDGGMVSSVMSVLRWSRHSHSHHSQQGDRDEAVHLS
uniref:Uncharacterized protein n=1 Tax=Anopheles farauti TaxID=69004 RepID=A0A182QW61_9DIPT